MESEHRPGCNRKRVIPVLAAPLPVYADEVVLIHHSADRAGHRRASAPAHFLKRPEGLFLGQFKHLTHRQLAGLGEKQEVLFAGHFAPQCESYISTYYTFLCIFIIIKFRYFYVLLVFK